MIDLIQWNALVNHKRMERGGRNVDVVLQAVRSVLLRSKKISNTHSKIAERFILNRAVLKRERLQMERAALLKREAVDRELLCWSTLVNDTPSSKYSAVRSMLYAQSHFTERFSLHRVTLNKVAL